jgi:hypothetical protein
MLRSVTTRPPMVTPGWSTGDAQGYAVAVDDVALLITKDFYTYKRIILRQDKTLRDHGSEFLN